jgi:hypothetical protein
MKRAVLPLAILATLSLVASGTVTTASQANQESPTVKNDKSYAGRAIPSQQERTRTLEDLNMETIKVSGTRSGNYRFPSVCENPQGDRLVIFRGNSTKYWYTYLPKGGSWTTPAVIPGAPSLAEHATTDIEADGTGRFHCIWEDPDEAVVYGSFLDGTWSNVGKMDLPGKHDMGISIAVRSNDQVIAANADVIRNPYLTKDIFFFFKNKGSSTFSCSNMIEDAPSSTQPCLAVDEDDNIWLAYKAEPSVGSDELVTKLVHYNKKNATVSTKMVSDIDGWRFWPQVAVNTDGLVMVGWSHTQNGSYEFRCLNTNTDKWTEVHTAGPGIPLRPWATFWSKMVSHDTDFYWAVMDTSRILHLLKYDAEHTKWDDLGVVSKGAVEYHDVYAGYDKLLIAWSEFNEPTEVYLTTVDLAPWSRVRLQSVANLVVEKKVERGFFHGYYLNSLTWQVNPLNTEQELTIVSHRVYRKARTADATAWAQIAEVDGTVLAYEDRNISADSDFVYAVTCVDDSGNESVIE